MKNLFKNKQIAMGAVLAQGAQKVNLNPTGDWTKLDPSTLTLELIISGFIRLTLGFASIIFFFILVIGGIKWILASGDKGQTENARNQITAALVGLVIVFSAWAIASLVRTFFGIDIFNLNITPAV